MRQYQREAVSQLLKHRHGTFRFQSGTGKTITAIGVWKELGGSCVVLVPTLELQTQWVKEFAKEGYVATTYNGLNREISYITVITYASAARLDKDDMFWRQAGLIVADESHHLSEGPSFARILIPILKAPYGLGLTATPPADPLNVLNRVLPVIYDYPYADALKDGFVAPVSITTETVPLSDEEEAEYVKYTAQIRTAFLEIGTSDLRVALAAPGKWGAVLRRAIVSRQTLLSKVGSKVEKVVSLVEQTDASHARILLWSERVEALTQAVDALNATGHAAKTLTAKTPKKERKTLLQRWGTEYRVLATARVGDEGLDVPEVDVGIVLASSKTHRQATQRLGRLLRPRDGKVARIHIIVAEDTVDVGYAKTFMEVVNAD